MRTGQFRESTDKLRHKTRWSMERSHATPPTGTPTICDLRSSYSRNPHAKYHYVLRIMLIHWSNKHVQKIRSRILVRTHAPATSPAIAVPTFRGIAIVLVVTRIFLSTPLITTPRPLLPRERHHAAKGGGDKQHHPQGDWEEREEEEGKTAPPKEGREAK